MSDWVDGPLCKHCGKDMEMRPLRPWPSIILKGFEPMEYRHTANKEVYCYTRHMASPYDDANRYKEWRTRVEW